jgi:hypothetical protein
VGKLFSPPGERYFGCRHCHDLTYTTCQRSHVDDRVFRPIAEILGVKIKDVKAIMKSRGYI